ncbi:unnamed protein product [Scytosiphon promiscuus]
MQHPQGGPGSGGGPGGRSMGPPGMGGGSLALGMGGMNGPRGPPRGPPMGMRPNQMSGGMPGGMPGGGMPGGGLPGRGMLPTPPASTGFMPQNTAGRGDGPLPGPRPQMGGPNIAGGRDLSMPLAPNGFGGPSPNGGQGPGPMSGPRPQVGGANIAGGRGPTPPAPSGFPSGEGRGPPLLPGPGPQMGGVNMATGRGHGQGMPMGSGRPAVGGGRGGGPGEGGRGEHLIGGRPPHGPQRSPVGGPVNGPRAFGPAPSAAGPPRPVVREGNGAGGPRQGNGAGIPGPGPARPGLQDGRPPSMTDGAQGMRQGPFEGPNRRPGPGPGSGPGPGQSTQQGFDARRGFDNRPEMDTRRGSNIPGPQEMGRGSTAQPPPPGHREGFGGRQGPPQDSRAADTSKGRSVFDRLGALPSGEGGEVPQGPSARRSPGDQRQHPGETGGMREGGGVLNGGQTQHGLAMQQRSGVPQRPGVPGRHGVQQGSGLQPGPEGRDGPNSRQGPEMRRNPTDNPNHTALQRGQGMQRGQNLSERMVMGNAQGGRGAGQESWAGPSGGRLGQVDSGVPRLGMDQVGGPGRVSPPGMGAGHNRGVVGHGVPQGHPGTGGGGREGQSSGRQEYRPEGMGMHMPPQEATAQGRSRQQGQRGPPATHGQIPAQGQGHTGARVSPQRMAARLGHGPTGPAAGLHGEVSNGRGSGVAGGGDRGGGNGRPPQLMMRGGEVRGQPQPQHQLQHQYQHQHQHHQASSFEPQNTGVKIGADRGPQMRSGEAGAGAGAGAESGVPHGRGGSLAWGGFGVVKDESPSERGAGQGTRSVGGDRGQQGLSQDRLSVPQPSRARGGGDYREAQERVEAPDWRGSGHQARVGRDARRGQMAPERGGWEARKLAMRATVRCKMIPPHVGAAELSQHFMAFGKIVDIRLRAVTVEEGGKGEKEALVQFATARQAQACVSSPKAVLGNRFIVVDLSEVNLVESGAHFHEQYQGQHKGSSGTALSDEAAAAKAEADAADAAAALATRKRAHEKLIAQASKTREVVAQQRVLVLLEERLKLANAPIGTAKAKRDKVQSFLRMMQEKGKPEAEQARYRKMLDTLSAKVLVLEAAVPTGEVQTQRSKLAELEAEARAMGATIPPRPNPAVLARLVEGGGRGSGAEGGGGRGGGRGSGRGGGRGRGRGNNEALSGASGRGSGAGEPRVARSLDNRPTTVKVSGLPESAGEGDLRVHANMAGVVIAAAMLRQGEGVVKFAERWAAEMFMSKSKSFGGIPLTMSWYTGSFPGSAPKSSQPERHHLGPSGSTLTSAPTSAGVQQMAPVINADGEGDRIELRLAPVQQESHFAGPRGGGGWGDDFGKEEGVGGAWGSTAWGKGDQTAAGSGDGSTGSSPLRLPSVEGGDEDDELYRGMAS